MPQYAALLYTEDADWTQPEHAEMSKEYMEFGEAAAAVLRGGAALYPTSTATTVTLKEKGGEVVTSDGPYAETKEALTGFYLIEADDLDAAIATAAKIPAAWGVGGVEVRPVIEFPG
jgi:hypothetical protein